MRVNQAPSMLPLFTPQPHIPATGVSQTIIKQDQEKCETRALPTSRQTSRAEQGEYGRAQLDRCGPIPTSLAAQSGLAEADSGDSSREIEVGLVV
jgi:hypothetical protein